MRAHLRSSDSNCKNVIIIVVNMLNFVQADASVSACQYNPLTGAVIPNLSYNLNDSYANEQAANETTSDTVNWIKYSRKFLAIQKLI